MVRGPVPLPGSVMPCPPPPARLLALVLAASLLAGCTGEAPEDMLASARSYQAAGDSAAAEIELKRLLERDAESAEARLMLGKLLLSREDAAGAEVEFQRALSSGAPESEVLPPLAKAMLMTGKPRQVIESYGAKTLRAHCGVLARDAARCIERQLDVLVSEQCGQSHRDVEAGMKAGPHEAGGKARLRPRLAPAS